MNICRLAVEALSLGKKVKISLKITFLKHQYKQKQFKSEHYAHHLMILHYITVKFLFTHKI